MESEGRREETARWQRKVSGFGQKWQVFLEKNPLPIQPLLPKLHLLPPPRLRGLVPFAGGPAARRSATAALGLNETVSSAPTAASEAIFILKGHLDGNKQPLRTALFMAGQRICDEIRPIHPEGSAIPRTDVVGNPGILVLTGKGLPQ